MKLRRFIISMLVALAVVTGASAAARTWEEAERFPATEQAMGSDDVSVTVRDGYVYLLVRQSAHVKLFTILGQVIVQDTLRPGVYRYKLASRGIYLLKAGTTTTRITL